MKMIFFNVLFEDDKEDVDIICVPDYIAIRMDFLAQQFLNWLPNADNDMYWTILDGKRCSVCETDGFIKWLNDNHCKSSPMASIINKHVQFVDGYNTIEF